MKSLAMATVFPLISVRLVLADQFCDGFEHGYIDELKQILGSPVVPPTPPCPLKPSKKVGDPDSDFKFGYNIGFMRAVTGKGR
jgi:hypothetical protein